MELTILLRLLVAHFLGDFMLQPQTWVKAKANRKAKAPELYYHVLVIGLLSYIALWDWANWIIPLIIMVSHLAIDLWKSYRPDNFKSFITDQLLHIGIIVMVWLICFFDGRGIQAILTSYLNSVDFWIIILAYYLVTEPLGIAIGIVTRKWQTEAGMDKAGLTKAGIWIGRFERILVVTFIILNQYTALGFLMAAKSILRFGDAEERAQKKTEYILVGTLISFASAAIIGAISSYLLEKY